MCKKWKKNEETGPHHTRISAFMRFLACKTFMRCDFVFWRWRRMKNPCYNLAFVNIRPFAHNIHFLHTRVWNSALFFYVSCCFCCFVGCVFVCSDDIAICCAYFVWFWFRYTVCERRKTCFLCLAATGTATHYFILCLNLFLILFF